MVQELGRGTGVGVTVANRVGGGGVGCKVAICVAMRATVVASTLSGRVAFLLSST
jgi:hypothetical protein